MNTNHKNCISVDMELLKQNTDILTEKTDGLEKALSELVNQLEQMSGMWQGDAADAFEAETEDGISAAKAFLELAKRTKSEFEYVYKVYRENHQKSKDVIDSIVI